MTTTNLDLASWGPLANQFDAITLSQLRDIGGTKWSMFPDAIGAFVAEMDYGTAPAVGSALHAAIDKGLTGYTPPPVKEQMSIATSHFLSSRYGWTVASDRIRPMPDVLSVMRAMMEHFMNDGSAVIVPTPAYMPFLKLPPAADRRVIQVPMLNDPTGRYTYDLKGIDKAFRDGGEMFVLCNPLNPVGRVLEHDEMLAIAEIVDRHQGIVFSDEIHAPLVFPGHQHLPYASINEKTASHTITATSASKAWNLPGLKAAQMILSNDNHAEVWSEVGQMPEHGASILGIIANTAAYSAGVQWLDDVITYLDGNRQLMGQLLAEHIPGIKYIAPEGTYLTLLDCCELGLGDSPAEFFREKAGVAMTDGVQCGDAGKGHARFNLALPRPLIEQSIKQMATALKS